RLEKTLELLIKFKNEYDYLIINMGQQSTINMEEVSKTIYNLSSTMQKENIVALSCMFALDVTQKEYSFLHQSNIPVFVYPEDLTSSLKYIHDYNSRRKNILSRKANFQIEDLEIDWQKIKEIIKNDEKVNNYLSPLAVIQILKLIGLKIPKTQEYEAEEKEIDFPVVLKTASPSILHKTEFQGVYLNINSYQELHEKANKLKNLYPRVIIQKMIPNDIELIVGVRDRKLFLIGLGGIMVELLKKFEVSLLPLDDFQIENMLYKLGISKIFDNFRNKKYDKNQFFETLYKINNLIMKVEEIEEIEVNPLIINQEGSFVVDCRIKCKT
ncbi:MAG: acetate--CoA ligase family protein, partial [bacterium]